MKIYIACPPLFATGGTELLHQLHHKFKEKGVNSFIYYIDSHNCEKELLVAERFKKYFVDYDKEVVVDIIDDKKNYLIVPEIYFEKLSPKNINICQWWLSVDNFFIIHGKFKHDLILSEKPIQKLKNHIKIIINRFPYNNLEKVLNKDNVFCNFYQSEYALKFLKLLRLKKPLPLSDYINADLFSGIDNINHEEKEDIILYNPKKGIENIEALKLLSPKNFKWVAIENMTPQEVQNLFKKAKLYVDFGNHPGKDRIPREAAINDCCIITNREGSANNDIDIAIPKLYKFKNPIVQQSEVFKLIDDIFKNYSQYLKDFLPYKQQILNEEQVFNKQVDNFINLIQN
ncbi:MAG TPA: hypothetical protein DD740_04735 [Chryseobacterium sp.]|nr:hypothetical protein [Chryseobacterium sp.]